MNETGISWAKLDRVSTRLFMILFQFRLVFFYFEILCCAGGKTQQLGCTGLSGGGAYVLARGGQGLWGEGLWNYS